MAEELIGLLCGVSCVSLDDARQRAESGESLRVITGYDRQRENGMPYESETQWHGFAHPVSAEFLNKLAARAKSLSVTGDLFANTQQPQEGGE